MKVPKVVQRHTTLKDIIKAGLKTSNENRFLIPKKQEPEFPTIVVSNAELQKYAQIINKKMDNWKKIFNIF